jgi:drug/metabolite transporter (DMT)-like permease
MAWVYVGISVIVTAYGQLVVKWRVSKRGHLPATLAGKWHFFLSLLTDPWVLSAMATTFLAALCWMAALSKLELSKAYPFSALSFVSVLVFSGIFLDETISAGRVAGFAMVIIGLIVGVRS